MFYPDLLIILHQANPGALLDLGVAGYFWSSLHVSNELRSRASGAESFPRLQEWLKGKFREESRKF